MKHPPLLWIAAAVAIGIAANQYEPPGSWSVFVYPDRDNLLTDIKLGAFDSLEECRDAAISKIEQVSSITRADYECGYECDGGTSGGLCEKTER